MEQIEIAYRLIAAELARRMRAGNEPAEQLFIARLARPHPRPLEQEPLRGWHAIKFGEVARVSVGVLQRDQVTLPSDRQAAQVADVFTDGERAIYLFAGQLLGLELVILGDERGGALFKCRAIRISPPVAQGTVAIVFAALIIETVANFVADHGANTAVIDGVLGVSVEEGDRKSTRLNSSHVASHVAISYAVFCLKKK